MRTIAEVDGSGAAPSPARTPPRASRRRRRPARRPLAPVAMVAVLIVAIGALVVGGHALGIIGDDPAGYAAPGGADPVPTPSTRPAVPLQVGVVGSQAPQIPAQVADLGAHVMRDEFTASTTVDELAPIVDRLAARGIRLQPLVGWDDGQPAPDLTAVARWAAAFGPGGTHWAGRTVDPSVPMTDIELGNENAFYYKSGLPDDDHYRDLARAYGERAVAAARAVDQANPAVGVLVELESADGKAPTWIDETLAAGGPDLARLMHGPTIHPYGPDWREKLDRDTGYLRRHGVEMPFYVTEWGISSDNGPSLTDNYDWPVDLSYDQAGALLATAIAQMAADPAQVRQLLLYQVADQRESGSDTDREHYFGLLRRDGSDKGGYTAAVRAALRAHP